MFSAEAATFTLVSRFFALLDASFVDRDFSEVVSFDGALQAATIPIMAKRATVRFISAQRIAGVMVPQKRLDMSR